MRRLTVAATALVLGSGIAVGAYRLGRGASPRANASTSPPSAETESDSSANAQLADSLLQVNRRLAALEMRQVVAMAGKPAESGDTRDDARKSAPVSGEKPEPMDVEAMKADVVQRAAAVETALKTQARDATWAPTTESQVQAAVAAAVKDGAKFSIRGVKCFTTVCEMVLSAASSDLLSGSPHLLLPRIENMGSFDIPPPQIAADGSATVTYRLFRSGYPRPDQGT